MGMPPGLEWLWFVLFRVCPCAQRAGPRMGARPAGWGWGPVAVRASRGAGSEFRSKVSSRVLGEVYLNPAAGSHLVWRGCLPIHTPRNGGGSVGQGPVFCHPVP